MILREPDLRPATLADLPAIAAMVRRSEVFDGIPRVLHDDELADELDDEQVVLTTDTRVAVDADGHVVGYVYTYHLPSDVREERCYVFGTVDPAWRGRGIGRALIDFGVVRATEQLRSSSRSLPRFVRVQQYEWIADAHGLYAAAGFTGVRYHDEMLRSLHQLPVPSSVEGLRIVSWPLDRAEDVREAKNAAFADHWGSTPTSAANWERMIHGHGARADLSFVAVDEADAVIAHCWCARYPDDDELLGRRDGWIESLGTLRQWRGRGVASALIAHALHAFAADGLSHASIGVDSANPTGAARLYSALGFESVHRSVTHEIALAEG